MERKICEYVLKDQEVFVGLEDSKKTWKLCIRSGGIIVSETSMPAKYENLKNYFLNRFPGCRIKVIYEAGFRGFGLCDQLQGDGWECVVTPPHTVTEEKCQRLKNDRVDSRRLAKNLENNDYGKCHIPDKTLREDRQISRTYEQVKRDISRVCNRIRRSLEFHGFDENFKPGAWNRTDYILVRSKLKEIGISERLQFSFTLLLDELEYLWELKKKITKELMELAKSEKYKENVMLIKSVPGIGILTAIRLLLEWGNLDRFKRKEKFSKFIGLIPGEYSSGEKERKGHITKQGNGAVRGWLIESAWIALRKDPVLLNKFNRVISSSGSRKKSIVAVARKLSMRIRAVVLSGKPYIVGLVE
jgi:transposase